MFRNRGIGTIAALVVLVILGALAAAIVVVSSSQQAGAALDLQGARTLQAARSGIDWGLYQALKGGSCAAATNIGPLDGISVTVGCTTVASGAAIEQGLGTIYRIIATACQPASAGACPGVTSDAYYVERRLEAIAEQ
jgi:MSHA biogenesis protein MshP